MFLIALRSLSAVAVLKVVSNSLSAVNIKAGGTISLVGLAAINKPLSSVNAAISIIATDRGRYGATINRLDHAISNFQNIATNLATAKGRIEDADFAAETSNLARTQVLQQASMAMLAQANASKQNILSLFQ